MSAPRTIGAALFGCALVLTPTLGVGAAETLNPTTLGVGVAQTPNQALNPSPNPLGAPTAQGQNQTPSPTSAAQLAPEVDAEAAEERAAPEPRPFDGSLGAGLAEVRRLTEAEDVDAALAVTERLLAPDPAARLRAWLERQSSGLSERALAWFDATLAEPLRALGLDPGTSAERAEVHYARGVALRVAARAREAREAFDLVRGLGGAARPDAVYELGHIALLAGEGWRSQIPELAPPGSQPPAAQAPVAAPPGAKTPDEPDPLQEARRAYQTALETFVERLRLDWRDADTRANVELVRRRLRELDELEQQREEQQEQQQQDQQQDGEKQDQQEQDPQKQDQDKQDPQEGDPEQEGQPEEQPDPQEGEPEEQPEPEAGEQPEDEPATEEEPEATPEPEEGELTKEQIQRMQQLLEQHQQRGEEINKALRKSNRGRTARDW